MTSGETSWRGAYAVLVTDAHAMGSIGVIRSLGRAGYRVVACADRGDALGLQSRYAALSLTNPHPGSGATRFLTWLDETVARYRIAAIVPSESVLLALRSEFAKWKRFLPLSGSEAIVYAGMSKFDLFQRFAAAGQTAHLPPFLLLEDGDPLPSAGQLADLGTPLFIKVDAAHARADAESQVIRSETVREARRHLDELRALHKRVLLQGYVHGSGYGAFLLRWNDEVLARFMHKRLHEVPHTGGASSYRRAWWDPRIMDDAERRASLLGWQGVAMFEYRMDPATKRFNLLELNGRFWGSLHLALYAGVDFPRLLLDAFFGKPQLAGEFRGGTRCRWTFPRDVEYLWSYVRDPRISLLARCGAVGEFLLLSAHPGVRSDLNFPGDRALYWKAIGESIRRWRQ